MGARRTTDDSVPRARRTVGQRVLLGLSSLLVVGLLAGAGAVAWTAAKFRSIEREEVLLDRLKSSPGNYLIVGSDSRARLDPDGGTGESRAPLADTMMVVRIDPEEETVWMLSMPRDLWVTLPNGEKGRLNAAYAHGPQDLIDTIRAELDIPIHHYLEVDFQGFQSVIDAVGGIPMWFDRAMRDRNSGLDVLHPGCVTLDGRSGLAFARSRHLQYFRNGGFAYDGTGDLGRISRQQVFIRRVLARATDQAYKNPLTMKRLVDVGVEHVTLDSGLSVGTLVGIGERFAEFDPDELETYTVPATPRTTAGGAAVLEIDRAAAKPILAKFRDAAADVSVTTTTVAPTSTTPGPFPITVLNASGVPGRAEAVAGDLDQQGFTVERFGNGAELGHETEDVTVVRHAPGHEDEARSVAAGLPGDVAVEEDDTLDDEPVVVFLGVDDGATSTTADSSSTSTAEATTTTSEPVGIVPGDPPPGRSCG